MAFIKKHTQKTNYRLGLKQFHFYQILNFFPFDQKEISTIFQYFETDRS